MGDDPDFYLGRFFSPASGLLAGRSRPGANIEARLRFNPRSGRVALIDFFWNWTSCLFSSGVRWTMVWSGARFKPRSGRVALIAFFDWTACLFSSGGSVDDGLARGALQPAFWVRCVDCFFWNWASCLFYSGLRWTMVWRGARFNPRFGCVALIVFSFLFLFLFRTDC